MIFRESFQGIVEFINVTKFSSENIAVYHYITLSVSGNYTVTAYDIVDGTINITNPSIVYSQVLEYTLPICSAMKSKYTSKLL